MIKFRYSFIPLMILFALFLFPSLVSAQPKEPSVDDVADVSINIADTSEKFKARITLYAKEPLTGELTFRSGSSINPSGDPQRIYTLRDVARITVTAWGKSRKGKMWVFYPAVYEIILKNQTRISHTGNIDFLNRIVFTSGQGKSYSIFTFYYDYFKNGKWINTDTRGMETPPLRPAAGTLYIIELN
jgi:hypothetical protein